MYFEKFSGNITGSDGIFKLFSDGNIRQHTMRTVNDFNREKPLGSLQLIRVFSPRKTPHSYKDFRGFNTVTALTVHSVVTFNLGFSGTLRIL